MKAVRQYLKSKKLRKRITKNPAGSPAKRLIEIEFSPEEPKPTYCGLDLLLYTKQAKLVKQSCIFILLNQSITNLISQFRLGAPPLTRGGFTQETPCHNYTRGTHQYSSSAKNKDEQLSEPLMSKQEGRVPTVQ